MALKKNKFYAYLVPATGKRGVEDNWPAVEKHVKGVTGARYRSFDSMAEAEEWLKKGAAYEVHVPLSMSHVPGIYFDAGTGRGDGVEISVTDGHGKNLLHKAVKKSDLNKYGKQLVGNPAATNNYGELLALKYALQIAKKIKVKRIFGDSRLVIDYWSKWRIKRKELPAETVALAAAVAKLREQFEKTGGSIERISGGQNPADLGFHK